MGLGGADSSGHRQSSQLSGIPLIRIAGIPESWHTGVMDTVKIGKKGQVTIPRRVLEAAGLVAETQVIVEPEADGSIRLRPAAVYPIEIYSEERVAEFESENRVDNDLTKRTEQIIGRKR